MFSRERAPVSLYSRMASFPAIVSLLYLFLDCESFEDRNRLLIYFSMKIALWTTCGWKALYKYT